MWKRLWVAVLLCGTLAALLAARAGTVRDAELSGGDGVSVADSASSSDSALVPASASDSVPVPASASDSAPVPASAFVSDSASLAGAEPPLLLCLAYYDTNGRFISVEITENATPDPVTGETILPIREIPPGAVKMKVFLLDQRLREVAPVTEGQFPSGVRASL